MAVAEKPSSKTTQTPPTQQFALAGILGGIFVYFALSVVLAGLPLLWVWDFPYSPDRLIDNAYLSTCLLMFVCIGAAVALGYVGAGLERASSVKGQRAASVVFALGLFLAILAGLNTANWMADVRGAVVCWALGGVVAAAILIPLLLLFSRAGFGRWLVGLEDNGWFHARSFKPTQGVRVRRATLIALLVILGSGVWAAVFNRLFGRGTWDVPVPFTDFAYYVLFRSEYVGPLLAFAVLGWLAWRAVNLPSFADFLIATEAEMNKVSWTTRKRLFQDTIVVLVTVAILTIFLFLVDILWIQLLKAPFPGVLKINPWDAQLKGPAEW